MDGDFTVLSNFKASETLGHVLHRQCSHADGY